MLAKIVVVLLGAILVSQGCSSGAPHASDGSDALIVPVGLPVSPAPGFSGSLDLVGLTLRDGPDGLLIDAALKNDADGLSCSADLDVQLYDANDQPLADVINGLFTNRFYSFTTSDGSSTLTGCAAPGDVTMTEVQAPGVAVSDVHAITYLYHAWALDAVLVDGLTVSAISGTTTDAGISYTGTVINGFDVALDNPQIAVFPVSRVGRPLGLARASDSSQIPPGGSWAFHTDAVQADLAASYAAYPAGSPAN